MDIKAVNNHKNRREMGLLSLSNLGKIAIILWFLQKLFPEWKPCMANIFLKLKSRKIVIILSTSGSVWDRFCRNGQRFTFGIFTFKSRNIVDSFIRTFAFYVKWATPTFACPNSIRCGVLIKTEIFALEFVRLTVLWNNMYLYYLKIEMIVQSWTISNTLTNEW